MQTSLHASVPVPVNTTGASRQAPLTRLVMDLAAARWAQHHAAPVVHRQVPVLLKGLGTAPREEQRNAAAPRAGHLPALLQRGH